MNQYVEKYKKNIVIDMRKRGYSYSEIQNSMHLPKSTIAFWLKGIKLTPEQEEKLKNKKLEVARANSEKRKAKTLKLAEEIKKSSAKDIGKISKRELWLMGIMIYWRERLLLNDAKDIEKGVNFTSSDPYLIKIFLKWLKEAGRIESEEIIFDIFLRKDKRNSLDKVIDYWSEVVGYSKESFTHFYFLNRGVKNKNDNKAKRSSNYKSSELGLLRIRVRASSMLARQMGGWMKGIQRELV